ncbi:MAG: DNA-directed RNA polymerase subunit B'', partial [Candidatus Wolframiiraptor sp.]
MLKEVELKHEDLWEVIRAFIEDEGLVQHHLRSYNSFIKEGLSELIKSLGDLEIRTRYGTLVLKMRDPEIGAPIVEEIDGTVIENVTPMECRLRNLTYAAPLYVTMTLYLDGKPITQPEKVKVGILPIMVKSDICPLSKMSEEELMEIGEDPRDPGGYFIINGSERVIVAIEDLAPNRILVTEKDSNGGQFIAVVISMAHGRQARTEVTYKTGGPLKVFFSRIYKGIPAIIMLRALGMTNDRDILNMVSSLKEVQELLAPSFEEAEGIDSEQEALRYIGNRIAFGYAEEYRIQRAEQLIDNVFLPHIGTSKAARYQKAIFLCEMIGRVLETSLGIRKPTDRDHYANKRLKL